MNHGLSLITAHDRRRAGRILAASLLMALPTGCASSATPYVDGPAPDAVDAPVQDAGDTPVQDAGGAAVQDARDRHAAPIAAPATPGRRTFEGTGSVTKVDPAQPSLELDHDPIEGHMPAMRMEWYVSDPSLLEGVAVGDRVAFTLEVDGSTERIIALDVAD